MAPSSGPRRSPGSSGPWAWTPSRASSCPRMSSPTPASRPPTTPGPPERTGTRASRPGSRPTPPVPRCWSALRPTACPRALRRPCRPGRWVSRWPPVRRRARCSPPWPAWCPSCGAGRRTWPARTTRPWPGSPPSCPPPWRSPRATDPSGAPSTSVCASTPWDRSSTGSRWTGSPAPTGAPSWCSPTTCARPCAWRHSWGSARSSCGPTTPSGSARTAPRTSPSSTWRRCAPSPACPWCAPGTPTRPPRPGRRSCAVTMSRPASPCRVRTSP